MRALTSQEPTRVGRDGDAVLVEPEWLHEHLLDQNVRVVEVDVGPAAYQEGHIDGAVLWNVYADLKDTSYRLRDSTAIQHLLARSGIGPATTVVFYGYAPAMGMWLMKLYGHPDARILNCSRQTWQAEDRPWSTQVPASTTGSYPLPPEEGLLRANQLSVQAAIDDPTCTIVDVRTAPEFNGDRFWPSGGLEEGGRAGHVPSARHLSIDGVFDARGAYRRTSDLRALFAPIDLSGDGDLITYCTIGGRACTAWFVLRHLLGRDRVRVYDGSWAEWGRMPTTPVAAG